MSPRVKVAAAPLCHKSWSADCPLQARASVSRGTQMLRMCLWHAWDEFTAELAEKVVWDPGAREPHLMELYRARRRAAIESSDVL